MKRIGSEVRDLSLKAALGQLEASREARPGKAPSRPQDAPGRPSEAGGTVRSLERVRAAQRLAKAAQLEALAREAGMPHEAAALLANALRAQAPSEWTFVMLSPSQNAAVVRWLTTNSKRRVAAVNLWARLFEVMRNDTGQIMQTREELAAHLGIDPDDLSRIMSELASINAIRRERNGRGVRYFMNSNIATHLPGPAARRLARESDGPLLVVMDGGRAD
jgi:hypothetical protein